MRLLNVFDKEKLCLRAPMFCGESKQLQMTLVLVMVFDRCNDY